MTLKLGSLLSIPAALMALLFSSPPVAAQTLSVTKTGGSYQIVADVPVGEPHSLQVSENFRLWVDVRENVEGVYSFALDETGVTERYFRLAPTGPPLTPIRIMVIGDSMSSDCCGWGRGLYDYFKPDATVINYAQPWTSSKAFFQSAEMDKMLLVKPDYVLMNFGWSDNNSDPDRGSTPAEYKDNLRTLVETIRGFNGTPILVTVHASRKWDEQGKFAATEHPYNIHTRAIAAEVNTPLIDLFKITAALYTELGPSCASYMEWQPGDPMHSSQLAGVYISRLLTHALPDNFGPYLTRIFEQPPKP